MVLMSISVKPNKSAGVLIRFSSTNCSTSLFPKPSISCALREAKCLIASFRCAWQNSPAVQRSTASPVTLATFELQTGHVFGNTTSFASLLRLSSTTETICGITSPARRMITVSPIFKPKRSISSWLCKVALETVTPPTNIGFRRATGVIAPVRPT